MFFLTIIKFNEFDENFNKKLCDCFVRMVDEPCVMKYIEIVPRENFDNHENEDFVHIKQEPYDATDDVQIKVCEWHRDKLLSTLFSL